MASQVTVEDAFQPRSVMADPARFSGRGEQFLKLAKALKLRDSFPVVVGEGGVGKSSLAAQARQFAVGDARLIERFGANDLAVPKERAFITAYVKCSKSVTSLDSLLQRIENLLVRPRVVSHPHQTEVRIASQLSEDAISSGFIDGQAARECIKTVEEFSLDTSLSHEERLAASAHAYTRVLERPVLIVIDEADQMVSRDGLGSLVRTLSGANLKFLLVGIASTLSDLLEDHRSVERLASVVPVPLMSPGEAREVVDRALSHIADKGLKFYFDEAALQLTVESAAGYPWLVHLIGSEALQVAHDAGRRQVTHADVARSLIQVTRVDLAALYEARIARLARGNNDLLTVLRVLADAGGYRAEADLLSESGLDTSETVRDDLAMCATGDRGALLLSRRSTGGVFYSIREPMIGLYLRLRPVGEDS